MLKKNNVDMLSGSIFKGLLALTIPIMIMNVMQVLFNLIDMTILGKFADDGAVGAVGTCSVLISLCTGLFIGVSTGANVVVAKSIGSGDKERTERAIGTAIFFSVIGGIVLFIVGICFAEFFLKLVNCPESLLDNAVVYFRLYFAGVPMLLVYNFCASLLRAGGDTKRPMYFLLTGSAVKVICNFIFVTSFNMSVGGVGCATIIANILISTLAFVTLLRSETNVKFMWNRFKLYPSELKSMLHIGIPAGLQTALYSFANTLIVATVNSFGPDATTGISIANQYDGILYHICVATSYAAMPYVAQNIGANNFKRAKKAIVNAIFITIIFGAGFGSLSAIFSPQLSAIMSSTPAVIAFSCQKMIVVSSTYFICGINEVMGGTLRGLGKPVIPTVATLMFMCLFRFVWVYFIFPLCPPTLTFLYLVWPVGWILCIITQLVAYFITMGKLQKGSVTV